MRKCLIDEIVFVLDRCDDRSEEIIRNFRENVNFNVKIVKKTKASWINSASESFELGTKYSSGDIVYHVGADLKLDCKMFSPQLWKDQEIGVIYFLYYHYQLEGNLLERLHCFYVNNIMKLFLHFSPYRIQYTSGLYAFRRNVWEHVHLRDVPSEYLTFINTVKHLHQQSKSLEKADVQFDDFLERSMKQYKTKFVTNLHPIHLRAGLTKNRQIVQGYGRFHRGDGFLKSLIHSILYFKLYVILYYLYAKRGVFTRYSKTFNWGK